MGKPTDLLAHQFERILSFAQANLDILMTSLMDKSDHKLFYGLWRNFVAPIQEGLKSKKGKERLKKTLAKLNVQWNGFHFQVDREHGCTQWKPIFNV